jgi:outer membrane immunogenic protein
MRRLVIVSLAAGLSVGFGAAAFAADLGPARGPAPVYTKAPLMAPWGWTGFYAGVSGGYGWSSDDVNTATTPIFSNGGLLGGPGVQSAVAAGTPSHFDTDPKGFIGGGTLGYNFQSGQFVWGVETDLSWANIKGTQSLSSGVLPVPGTGSSLSVTGTGEQKMDAFGTLRGRLGFTPTPPVLLYATGGLAYGRVESNTDISATPINFAAGSAFTDAVGSVSSWRAGWTAGAGIEYMIAPHWTVKAEYLYYDLGTISYNSTLTSAVGPTPFTSTGVTSTADFKGNIVRSGINYKF